MSYAAHDRDLMPCCGENAAARRNDNAKGHGALRRALRRMLEWRQKEAERDIARFLAGSGGRLTDEMEREMTQRLFKGNWNPRRL